jgi:hypothetical protein
MNNQHIIDPQSSRYKFIYSIIEIHLHNPEITPRAIKSLLPNEYKSRSEQSISDVRSAMGRCGYMQQDKITMVLNVQAINMLGIDKATANVVRNMRDKHNTYSKARNNIDGNALPKTVRTDIMKEAGVTIISFMKVTLEKDGLHFRKNGDPTKERLHIPFVAPTAIINVGIEADIHDWEKVARIFHD